jgi:pimeloyl-ACP methyl ester carboxylesterase
MEHITSKDGAKIGVFQTGVGRPLLFVHGMVADHRSWLRLAGQLDQNFTIYALDRRGRGGSGDSPEYDFLREVEDVVAVVESIGEPVSTFGHSLGGLFCLEAALMTAGIDRLILYEPHLPTGTSSLEPGIFDRLQDLIHHNQLEAAMELFFRAVVRMPEHELEIYRQTPLWEPRLSLAPTIPRELSIDWAYRFDPERMAKLTATTLLLVGGNSPDIYRRDIDMLHSVLPNSQVVVLPGQQHIAHHLDPDLLARELLQFLSG